MKRFNILLIALLGFSSMAFGQSHWCATDHSEEFMDRLSKNVKYSNTHEMRMDDKRLVPVTFHLVADNLGNGRIDKSSVMNSLCAINEHYDSIGMLFYVAGEFQEHDLEAVFNHDVANNGSASGLMVSRKIANTVNVYVVNDVGDAGGYYSPNGDFIAIPKSFLTYEDNVPFDHEVGHFFSLSHPHYGWESNPYTPEVYGETVTITSISSNQSPTVLVEVVDDPDCHITGDRICDTPPDYGFMQSAGACNNPWEGTVKDRNGELIYTIPNLVMTYNNYACQTYNFTHGQSNAMRADYDARINIPQGSFMALNGNGNPDTTGITELPALISPLAFETTDYFDSVVLQWEPSLGAQQYLVTIGGQANLEFLTTDTELELTELEPSKSYSWSVTPINQVGHCLTATPVLFFTGTGSTAVIDIAEVSSFAVHPNPVRGHSFNITIDSKESLDANISLLNIAGQTILNEQITIKTGSNLIPVQLENVQTGVYQLYIRTSNGILTEKIIIE